MQEFNNWNRQKQQISKRTKVRRFHQREIVWLRIGVNIGREQNGKNEFFLRPVLIIKKINSETFIGVPLTTKNRRGRFIVPFEIYGRKQYALIAQLRMFDARRIFSSMGTAPKSLFVKIKQAVKQMLDDS